MLIRIFDFSLSGVKFVLTARGPDGVEYGILHTKSLTEPDVKTLESGENAISIDPFLIGELMLVPQKCSMFLNTLESFGYDGPVNLFITIQNIPVETGIVPPDPFATIRIASEAF